MGLYLRKSFGFGPLRLNLSRSGLGASFGVKGARVGLGPRGSYVHVGRGGLYYRRSLGSGTSPQPARTLPPSPISEPETLKEIESADVTQMVDAPSADLLKELNRVQNRVQVLPILLLVSAAIVILGVGVIRPPWWGYAIGSMVGLPVLLYARHADVTRGTAVLQYDLEPDSDRAFSELKGAFGELASCGGVWHVEASGATRDWKRHAGANTLVRRRPIQPVFSRPPRVLCNLEVPTLPAGRQTLYFFPDRVLVYERRRVGAVPYTDLQTQAAQTRFREEESVPGDAQVVGSTWKYVNKRGGPDRRFKDNRELPIALYGEVHLTSSSGLNERFQCSQPDVAAHLASAISQARLDEAT